ncbi:beta-ketoacyl synthase N-terminal-like domain-containing protein [Micromonospora sp. NPDC051296]|uniref:type I polyketide synthase n=1 Tax=Micromonospora sp. NPDC051296 TaxID=3155046 RepID=UPI00341CD548
MTRDDPATRPFQVAVIGVGCRLPGDVDSPDALWELLLKGGQTSGEIPAQRWRAYRERGPEYEAVLRETVTAGSYLGDVAGFDAEFFGLTPREAAEMDPQQRILLEVGWEALEHAGLPPTGLAGTDTGVFIGVSTTDYGDRLLEDLPSVEAWTGIGAATCALANRVSYALDLRGPSVAVDTACSASLVAVHLACQSLLLGESTVALAGGVNLVLTPGQNVSLQAAGTLAPDGVSKSFDRDADGYGRGEGCGVLVLKRLDDAVRDGDRVLAVILGSAVNQDGHTDGIMAPSGEAQQHVVRRACERAGITPDSVDYVEAHGTGTRLGDPVEAGALSAVYGAGRPAERPCLIGSIKSNIGHLEGAAGVAGLMKAILALHRGQIPGTPLRGRSIPAVDADGTGLRLVTGTLPWPRRDGPRRAAVSGFGYGGTIGHVVLEQAPPVPSATGPEVDGDNRPLLPLSARSDAGLRAQAGRLADRLDGDNRADLTDVGHTLAHRRAHLNRRAVVTGEDRDGVVAALRRLAAGQPDAGTVSGVAPAGRSIRPVWVFSGHGSHWAGMGRDLLAHEPAFAAAIDEIEPAVAEEAGFSLRAALADPELGGVDRIQTLTFAMHVGLAAVWRAYGVRPAAVIGHSVGEVAAAVTAGVLSPADGARLICRRSALLRRAAGRGAMAMVTLPFADVAERLAGRANLVAAIASAPASTVVSGDIAAVDEVIEQWPADRIGVRRVQSDVAFHSPHMDPLTDELRAAAADLDRAPAVVPMYSTVLDDPRETPACDGDYWAANLRRPVRLVDAVAAALADGHRAFVEISAHPVIAHSLRETVDHADIDDAYVGTTLRRHAGHRAVRAAVAEAYCHGVEVDWARLRPDGRLTDLPRYAWQHREHWREPEPPVAAGGHDIASNTLLGTATSVAGSELRLWHTVLTDASRPYPGSHTVQGAELVPAAVLVATFLAAGARDGAPVTLHDLSMRVPLATNVRQEIQVVDDNGRLVLASRPAGGDPAPWLTHATAQAVPADAPLPGTATVPPGGVVADAGLVREHLARVGVPDTAFAWTVDRLITADSGLRARVRFPEAACWAAVVDAAVSVAPVAFPGEPRLRLVDGAERIETAGPAPSVAVLDVVRDATQEDTVTVLVTAPDGRVVGRLAGLRYPVVPDAPAGTADGSGPAGGSLADLNPEELRERLVDEVRAAVAAEMKLPVESLDPRLPLVQQGMDSVMTVIVRRRLEKTYRQVLPASLFWQQPTVTAIATHLAELLAAPPQPAGAAAR